MHVRLPVAQPVRCGRHQRGRRASATGHGLAGAALPHAHVDVPRAVHAGELDVGPVWEQRVALQIRAVAIEPLVLRVQIERHRVGIAHVDTGEPEPFAVRQIDGHVMVGGVHRNPRRIERRRAHVHAGVGANAVLHRQRQRLDSRAGLHGQPIARNQARVVHVLADAADGVAAHVALAAVLVEHAHPAVRRLRGQNQHQPVRADAEVRPGHGHGQRRRILRCGIAKAVDIDVIVAQPVHLHKLHRFILRLSGSFSSIIRGGCKNRNIGFTFSKNVL